MRATSFAAVGFAVMATASSAFAQAVTTQGFLLDRFEPAERGSDWFVLDDIGWSGQGRPSIGLVGDLGVKPLVVLDESNSSDRSIVADQLFAHVGGAIVFLERFRVGISLPVALVNSGDTQMVGGLMYGAPDSATSGDLRLGFDARVLGEPGGAVALAAGVQIFLPTGNRDQYTGDSALRLAPHLLVAARHGIFSFAGRFAFQYRNIKGSYNGFALGSNVDFGVGAGVHLVDEKLFVGPEVYGSTSITSSDTFFSKQGTPLEALLGAHYRVTKEWRASAGLGVGLTHGFGTPVVRTVLGVEYTPAAEAAAPPPPVVTPPEPAKVEPPKPVEPPPPDRDNDTIPDAQDACPDVAGVKTDDPATNGCPPPPPPPPDRDGDGIVDADDACPDEPGVANADAKLNGCPQKQVVVTRSSVVIAEQIKFATDSDKILHDSDALLGTIAQTLIDHAEIKRVRVEGHTDSTGPKDHNQRLSERRAKSVVAWLVAHNVDPARLESQGFGMDQPIDTNNTAAGRKNNRRVEFKIVDKGEQP